MKADKSKQPTLDSGIIDSRGKVFEQGCKYIDNYSTMLEDIRKVMEERDETHTKMSKIKNTVFSEVSKETNMGKAVFSNDTTRTAETERRLALKKEYTDHQSKYEALDSSVKAMRDSAVVLEKQIGMFKAFLTGH